MLDAQEVKIKKVSEEGNTGVFSFEPLPKGFGHTLGNTMRRVLLTSLKGGAATQLKVDGAVHEFTTVSGIKEDMVEVTLNLKDLRVRVHGDNPVVGKISKKGAGKVTAKDIEVSSEVEIINKDLHIATLADAKSEIEAEIVFEPGVGYSPVEERETSKIGVILLDAIFSPVTRATYEVEATRKGTQIDLDKLVLMVETDGSVTPEEAITESATILRKFFARFSDGEDDEEVVDESVEEEMATGTTVDAKRISVDELPLPTRTINALRKAEVETLAELAKKSDEDLADIKNLGEKSIEEIKKLLEKEGLAA